MNGWRMAGFLLVVATGWGLGAYAAARLRSRRDGLAALLSFVRELHLHMRYTEAPLYELIDTVTANAEGTSGALRFLCDTDPEQMCERLLEWGKDNAFTSEDGRVAAALTAGWGKTDMDGQNTHLSMIEQLLERRLEEAEEAVRQKSRMCKAIGLSAGLAVGIMCV